jgi:hypothetical protein
MAFRIMTDPEAFTGPSSWKRKRPRVENKDHLGFVRRLPCCCCGARPVDAAHIRMASAIHGKRETGIAQKADDRWTLPLCRKHHDQQHSGSEAAFWNAAGIDPFLLALILWGAGQTHDDEAAELAIKKARSPK